jgi:hypothetical protein
MDDMSVVRIDMKIKMHARELLVMLDMYRSMGWYAFNAVIRIQVLVERELEQARPSLPMTTANQIISIPNVHNEKNFNVYLEVITL